MERASVTAAAIQTRQLSFQYPGGPPALRDLSLRIAVGERVGLIGPNGAGKTTFFLCLTGVLPLPRGLVEVGGCDPAEPAARRQLPSQVGLVFQNSDEQLFSATVGDDVAFGPLNLGLTRAQARERVQQALARVGLSGYEERVPFHLSGGEKRRVALAGILAMQPAILLLDEPSMFLDARSRRSLIELLQGLSCTQVIASHDLELVLDICTRVVLLDQGKLIAEDAPQVLLANEALLTAHGLEVPYRLRR